MHTPVFLVLRARRAQRYRAGRGGAVRHVPLMIGKDRPAAAPVPNMEEGA
jgi:hypothetical protein